MPLPAARSRSARRNRSSCGASSESWREYGPTAPPFFGVRLTAPSDGCGGVMVDPSAVSDWNVAAVAWRGTVDSS